ncbi:MAG TPA: class I SAM-dependent methyltransferase [Gaiellaceae bacterium]|nr:class I SAM-dependent methyltransferase [Gaiellaceae bacterium]
MHERVVDVLAIQPGERVLDIGTGTGAVAIRAARAGAEVVGLDVAAHQIAKARTAVADAGVDVELVEGDCQEMAFADARFDVVASVFGFIFAPDHTRSGAEAGRVCRSGGRLALTAWTYDEFSFVGDRLGRPYPPGDDAREWSNEAHARERLPDFDLRFEAGEWVVEEESADALWALFSESVPPIKLWLEQVGPAEREEAKRAYCAVFPDGVLRRDYVLILGTKR